MRISKTTNHGKQRWRVTTKIRGKRTQRFFASRKAARNWVDSVENDSNAFWAQRKRVEKEDIILAFKLSQQRGQTIYQCVLRCPGSNTPAPYPLANAVSKYSERLKNKPLRPATLEQTQLHLNQLAAEFRGSLCNAITAKALEDWFQKRGWKRSTIDGVLSKISPFFSWILREKLIDQNPCASVVRPIADDNGPPKILTAQETRTLLCAAISIDPQFVKYFAIGLFAGVRPHEIGRLVNRDISEHYIEVSASKSKSRNRRLVTVMPNLFQWLRAYPPPIPSTNKRRRFEKIIKIADINWSQDVMRHSFASYHLAHFQSAEKTALEMGHRDTNILFRHYRELVTREEAQAFWAIEPGSAMSQKGD